MRAHSLHNIGCCVASAAPAPLEYTLRYTPGVYDISTLHLTARAVFTHTAPLAVYRGPGRAEGNYLIERLLDAAAAQLGIDRLEIRRRNAIPIEAMPYATQTGSVYDSGDFARMRKECLELADWDGFETRRAESNSRGLLRGRALIHYIEHAGIFNDRMEMRFDSSGALTVVAGTHSHGQGHATTYAQLAAEFLGVDFATVSMLQGDTAAVAFGRGTYAARSSLVGGMALRVAADRIIERARARAAFLLEVAEADLTFADGRFTVAGTDRMIGITDVAKSLFQPVHLPNSFDLGLEASGTASGDIPNYPNGCHVCEVEVDPETGLVRIARYAVVDDVGRAINPMICEGQIHGAIAQGVGQALLEDAIYSADGQLLTGSLMDYCLPRADDFCEFRTQLAEIPCATNPLGIKGVGESGTIGAPPALMNAVLDALRPLGVKHMDMPATPFHVWQAIEGARQVA
jgi:carbon-monoxide dehydrogenase large subunit